MAIKAALHLSPCSHYPYERVPAFVSLLAGQAFIDFATNT